MLSWPRCPMSNASLGACPEPNEKPNGMALDLHVHTAIGSSDCHLSLARLTEAAYQVGIQGFPPRARGHGWGGGRRREELRRRADEARGYLILAHPFRFFPSGSNYLFGPQGDSSTLTPEEMARHPAWELVDEIEVLNYNCTDKENELAAAMARVLGKRGTAGSDAHTFTEVGRCITVLERAVASEGELIEELRAGRHHLARRRPHGED